ncbi:MAG: T9SS type A sorting domain-containing protein [bacterium]|nr:T9SS type A sorting domain-containing protein [bacterium]
MAMGTPSGVPDAPLLDSQMQVYPNPFNPQTKIAFRLESAGEVSLAIFDVQGRLVRRLIEGSLAAGDYSVEWNGMDSGGRAVSAGTYLCRLSTAGGVQTRKLSLVR